jgi:hypothetical protein
MRNLHENLSSDPKIVVAKNTKAAQPCGDSQVNMYISETNKDPFYSKGPHTVLSKKDGKS